MSKKKKNFFSLNIDGQHWISAIVSYNYFYFKVIAHIIVECSDEDLLEVCMIISGMAILLLVIENL